jgi:hypothetical protein
MERAKPIGYARVLRLLLRVLLRFLLHFRLRFLLRFLGKMCRVYGYRPVNGAPHLAPKG